MKMLTILIVFLVCVFFLFRFHVFPCCFYTFCSRFLPSAISSCWTLEINFVWTFSAQLFIRLDLILSFYLIESHKKAAHAEEVAHVWVFNGAITAIRKESDSEREMEQEKKRLKHRSTFKLAKCKLIRTNWEHAKSGRLTFVIEMRLFQYRSLDNFFCSSPFCDYRWQWICNN